MQNPIEIWISTLHQAVPDAEFVSLEPEDETNPLLAAVWLLEESLYRIVGYGNAAFGKPEFVLEINARTLDEATEWALALLQFVDDHRHTSSLVPGALFAGTTPLVDFSDLQGWVVGLAKALDALGLEQPHLTVYPIYTEEVEVFKEVGLSKFLGRAGAQIHQPARKPIKKEPQ
jgi:hypothetical protein